MEGNKIFKWKLEKVIEIDRDTEILIMMEAQIAREQDSNREKY